MYYLYFAPTLRVALVLQSGSSRWILCSCKTCHNSKGTVPAHQADTGKNLLKNNGLGEPLFVHATFQTPLETAVVFCVQFSCTNSHWECFYISNLRGKKAVASLIEENVAWAVTYLIPHNISKIHQKQEIYFLKQAGKHIIELIKNTHANNFTPAVVILSFSTARFLQHIAFLPDSISLKFQVLRKWEVHYFSNLPIFQYAGIIYHQEAEVLLCKYSLSAHIITSPRWGIWSRSPLNLVKKRLKNQGEAQNLLMLIQPMGTQILTCDIPYMNLEKYAQTRKELFENKTMLHTFSQNKLPLTHILQNPLVYFRNLALILFDAVI